jgi:hypothetical protein
MLFPFSELAVAHTNEFQKRGLPHLHVLVWQVQGVLLVTPSDVDYDISAELPDPSVDPLGFSLVQEFMLHGPCGDANPSNACMKNGSCSKRYPKPYRSETSYDLDGYLLYRRHENGIVARKGSVNLDNRWVVPHNINDLKKYQCHINVEACNKSYLVKYLFKYTNKGFDYARVSFHRNAADTTPEQNPPSPLSASGIDATGSIDEIEECIQSRYLSLCKSFRRLLGFEIHDKYPSVERLCVHLPGMNFVTVRDESDLSTVVDEPSSSQSQLTEWFVANQRSPSGHALMYTESSKMFTWVADEKIWKRRQRGFKLGRIRYVHPTAGDTFFLRMLLAVVRGAKSYEDVRTYQSVLYPNFRDACQARGLIGDDTEWSNLFDEAVLWANSWQLRNLFMMVLIFFKVGNVRGLFDTYWRYI